MFRRMYCLNPACSANTKTIAATGGEQGRFTSIAIGADGLAVISYADESRQRLAAAHRADAACGAVTHTAVLDRFAVTFFPSMAIGRDGLPLISFFAIGQDVAHCGDAAARNHCTSRRCS